MMNLICCTHFLSNEATSFTHVCVYVYIYIFYSYVYDVLFRSDECQLMLIYIKNYKEKHGLSRLQSTSPTQFSLFMRRSVIAAASLFPCWMHCHASFFDIFYDFGPHCCAAVWLTNKQLCAPLEHEEQQRYHSHIVFLLVGRATGDL